MHMSSDCFHWRDNLLWIVSSLKFQLVHVGKVGMNDSFSGSRGQNSTPPWFNSCLYSEFLVYHPLPIYTCYCSLLKNKPRIRLEQKCFLLCPIFFTVTIAQILQVSTRLDPNHSTPFVGTGWCHSIFNPLFLQSF